MHAAAAAGSPALAALLKNVPRAKLPECTTTAGTLLHSFMLPYQLFKVQEALQSPSAALVMAIFWEQV